MMITVEIWVNPSCSKCRAATELLDEAGVQYTVRRYLDDPPTADELDAVLRRLGLEPWDVARLNEPVAAELGLGSMARDRRRWLEVMAAHPVLIQRPIITADDGTTVVGRSPEAVRQALRAESTRELPPARSYLYVPGTEREKLDKAAGRGSDAVIADLEDAVPPADKAAAREVVRAWLAGLPAGDLQAWVRINRDSLADDVAAVASPALAGIVLPKADPAALRELDRLLTGREPELGRPAGSIAVLPLVESAAGLLAVADTAAGPRVHRLGLGEADLIGELGLRPGPDREELRPIRLQLVVASAAAGISAPVAPTSTDFRDLESFRATSRALLALGFRGRTAVHPGQVPVIHEVFTPGEEEVAAARAVVARFEQAGSGVFVDDAGRMVDAAVVRSARETLSRARQA